MADEIRMVYLNRSKTTTIVREESELEYFVESMKMQITDDEIAVGWPAGPPAHALYNKDLKNAINVNS